MKININPNNFVVIFSLITAAGFYYFYADPVKKQIASTPIFGQNSMTLSFDDLTVIAKMPFLTYENNSIDIENLSIDDNIFYIPEIKVEEVVAEEEEPELVEVEAFAPVEIENVKPDYRRWAQENLKLQLLTFNGVVINDLFYRKGQAIEHEYVFDDGSKFLGQIVQIGKADVIIKGPDGESIKLTFSRTNADAKSDL